MSQLEGIIPRLIHVCSHLVYAIRQVGMTDAFHDQMAKFMRLEDLEDKTIDTGFISQFQFEFNFCFDVSNVYVSCVNTSI